MSKFRLWTKSILCLTSICILMQLLPPLQPISPLSLYHAIQTLEGGGPGNTLEKEERSRQSATWDDLLYLMARVASLEPKHLVNKTCFPPSLYNRSKAAGAEVEIPPSFCSSGPSLTGLVNKKSRKIFTMWILR